MNIISLDRQLAQQATLNILNFQLNFSLYPIKDVPVFFVTSAMCMQ